MISPPYDQISLHPLKIHFPPYGMTSLPTVRLPRPLSDARSCLRSVQINRHVTEWVGVGVGQALSVTQGIFPPV